MQSTTANGTVRVITWWIQAGMGRARKLCSLPSWAFKPRNFHNANPSPPCCLSQNILTKIHNIICICSRTSVINQAAAFKYFIKQNITKCTVYIVLQSDMPISGPQWLLLLLSCPLETLQSSSAVKQKIAIRSYFSSLCMRRVCFH